MRRILFLVAISGLLGSVLLLAQTQQPVRIGIGLPGSWHFYVEGVEYGATLDQQAVLATSDWSPSQPLPLGLASVEKIARQELRRFVKDDTTWEPTDFTLHRLSRTARWFYVVEFMPSTLSRDHVVNGSYDTVRVLVDSSGKPGHFNTIAHANEHQ